MTTGICTSRYYFPQTKQTDYEKMRRHGYDCADYQRTCDTSDLYTLPQDEFEKILTKEKEDAQKTGIFISQVHAPWPVVDTTEENRAQNMIYMQKAVQAASLLSSPYLVVHPLMPYGWDDEEDPDYVESLNEVFFKDLCAYAQKYSVAICIENMPMRAHRLSRTPRIVKLVDKLNLPNFFICLDTGHCNVFGDDAGEMARLCGDRLKVLHVHDNTGESDQHLWPYSGSINWDSFQTALKDIHFDGCLSIEANFNMNYPTSIKEDLYLALQKIAKSFTV